MAVFIFLANDEGRRTKGVAYPVLFALIGFDFPVSLFVFLNIILQCIKNLW